MLYVLPTDKHDQIVTAAYRQRGYTSQETPHAVRISRMAAWHGIKTHNALKAIHLDDLFGSGNAAGPSCVPDSQIIKLASKFPAAQKWNANKKLSQAVAFEAMDTAMSLADQYGVGIVSVDNAFHYLWGGGYVMDAAKKGYFAYTHCTSGMSEVVPFGGKYPTIGTNPHSWGLPTTEAVGFPIVIDWATSTVAMGRVQQFAREGKSLPPNTAVDKDGNFTCDPHQVVALVPFGGPSGGHKGYGLSLINELVAAMIGSSLPTLRSRPEQAASGEKTTPSFFFQVIHPEALDCGAFVGGRNQQANVKAVIEDILGHGNDNCMLPGQIEHEAAVRSEQAGGLLFTEVEINEFDKLAKEVSVELVVDSLDRVEGN